MKILLRRRLLKTTGTILFLMVFLNTNLAISAEKEKKPFTTYWMSVSTQNQSIPGMSEEEMSDMGGFMGKMMGAKGYGPSKNLLLQLNSPQQIPSEPEATHDIPPGQNMGKTLPLMIYEKAKSEKYEEGISEKTPVEKPKMRMLIYWGCGEDVGKGQPRIIDTEKMSPEEFGKSLIFGHTPSQQHPPRLMSGWIYADWPNKKSHIVVPKDSSLQGDHNIHGNYMPDIRFSIGQKHDFMSPVELTSKGSPIDSIKFQWKAIPTAIGYFAMAMANNQKTDELIIWSSSEVPETGFGLMDYLLSSDVRKFIKEKVVMDTKTTSCNIPRGIFKDAPGMIQFIAYGEDMYASYPPKPKDPKEPWNLIWTAKLRLKSTGMIPLGMEQDETKRPRKKAKEQEEETPSETQKSDKEEDSKSPLKKLKGIFGF